MGVDIIFRESVVLSAFKRDRGIILAGTCGSKYYFQLLDCDILSTQLAPR